MTSNKPRRSPWMDLLTVLFGMVLGAVVIFGAAYLLDVPLAEAMFR